MAFCEQLCKGSCLIFFSIINLLLLILGFVLFILSIIYTQAYFTLIDNQFFLISIIAIVFALLVINISVVLGDIFGVWKRKSKCLLAYSFLLLGLSPFFIALAIIALTIKNAPLQQSVEVLYQNYEKKHETTKLVDNIQTKLLCCGPKGPDHWLPKLPTSCCVNTTCTVENSHHEGCVSKFLDVFTERKSVVGIMLLLNNFVMMCCAFVAILLSQLFSNQQTE